MYAIKIDETNRVVNVSYPIYVAKSEVPNYPPDMVEEMINNFIPEELEDGYFLVETLPELDYHDYLYVDGEYVYAPLPPEEEPKAEPTTDDVLNALLGVTE